MELFAIADLHLSQSGAKPMHIFGDHWADHAERMASAWDREVGPTDLVLCPGDISWSMRISEMAEDLAWLAQRPGHKLITRGNHDYWWSSISKVRAALPEGCLALQNDALVVGDVVIAGSRLWAHPGSPEFGPADEKIYRREAGRLELSLQAARKQANDRTVIAAVHYPPLGPDARATAFSELLERYAVDLCVYGHLHGAAAHDGAVEGEHNGVIYALVASDYLGFVPRRLGALLHDEVSA